MDGMGGLGGMRSRSVDNEKYYKVLVSLLFWSSQMLPLSGT